MADPATLKDLIYKRGLIKSQMTHFETFLKKYAQERPDALKLRLRVDKLKSTFDQFDAIQTEIELLEEEPQALPERFEAQERYLDNLAAAQRLLDAACPDQQGENSSRESIRESASSTQPRRKIKLPEAVLPTFNGQYEEWLSFKDAFTTLIHNQNDLSNVEKLQYLKSTLKGEAASKIKVFSITDDNYTRAWDLLEKTYADKRLLISRHLSLLLRLPIQERETSEGLIKLADETQQHILSLSTLGVNVMEEMIVQNLEEKLHKSTCEKWDETLERGVFPKLDDMIEFLYRTAARIVKRDGQKSTRPNSNFQGQQGHFHPQSNGRRAQRHTKQAFVTTANGSACPICKDKQHPVYRCEVFRNMPVAKRIKIVKEASLCETCLNSKHEQRECKLGNCKLCNQRHNSLLHLQKEQGASTSQA